MDIEHEPAKSGGRYVARIDGHEAEMTYSRASASLDIVDHTGVPDALRDAGVARRRRGAPRRLEDPAALPVHA